VSRVLGMLLDKSRMGSRVGNLLGYRLGIVLGEWQAVVCDYRFGRWQVMSADSILDRN